LQQLLHLEYVNYNGHLIAANEAPPLVQGSAFRFPRGLFESMLLLEEDLQLAGYHFDRLILGLKQLNYRVPTFFTQQFFLHEVLRTAEKQEAPFFRVRFQVQADEDDFQYLVETMPVTEDVFSLNQEGWILGLAESDLKDFDAHGNLKIINIPLYTQGPGLAGSAGWNDVLLVRGNQVIESGGANIFWIRDGVVCTPPLSQGCIEGTMRRHLMTRLMDQLPLRELGLTIEELNRADEVFLTNAVRRIKWVRQIGQNTYINRLTTKIHSQLFA
jgi:branched-chain amino acid aminotransferase